MIYVTLKVVWWLGWSEDFWICWSTHPQPSLGFIENDPKKREYLVSNSCAAENILLIWEVRGDVRGLWRMGRPVPDDKKTTVTLIAASPAIWWPVSVNHLLHIVISIDGYIYSSSIIITGSCSHWSSGCLMSLSYFEALTQSPTSLKPLIDRGEEKPAVLDRSTQDRRTLKHQAPDRNLLNLS